MSLRNLGGSNRHIWIRLIAIVLAALMIISVAYIAIAFIVSASAANNPLAAYAFRTSKQNRIFHIAAGIRFGSSVGVSHAVTSPYGFVIGESVINQSDRSFSPLYKLEVSQVNVACDNNLSVGYNSCSFATTDANTDIGAYHVEISLRNGNAWDSLTEIIGLFYADYDQCFPAYIDGTHVIRIGSYANYKEASNAAAAVGSQLDDFTVSVASPATYGICILNEDYDTILFEYAGGDDFLGSMVAVQRENEDHAYLCYSSTSYLYDGAFCFRRYISNDANGLTLINLVGMQEYMEGVLPSEIPNDWPVEAQKAFAVTARAYAVSNLNKHFNAYGFDLCASSCCQNYMGRRKVNDLVIQASAETGNSVLSYDGSLIAGYYSSSQGGASVDTNYVWGGNTGPYIISQPTPWEDYANSVVKKGMWTDEITPAAFATKIKAGYPSLTGTRVTDVTYEQTGDSPYIYSMTVTDDKKNTVTVTRCSKVRGVLSGYVASANFEIAKGSLDYTYDTVISTRIIDLTEAHAGNLNVHTSNGNVIGDSSKFNFFTSLGQALRNIASALYVKTSSGTAVVAGSVAIPVSTTPDSNGVYTYVSDYGTFLVVTQLQEHTKTYTASSAANYIIVGRGNGHGVGMSQYGVYFLSRAEATYQQILYAYYPGTTIIDMFDYWAGR